MTATEPQITVHPEMSIEPRPVIAPDSIHPAPAEARQRGPGIAVYKVPSERGTGIYTVTYHTGKRTLYCTCEAAKHGGRCKHLASVLWKVAYEQAYRLYADLSLPELAERQRDYIEIERGAKAEARAWTAINAAIGDLVLDRLDGAA